MTEIERQKLLLDEALERPRSAVRLLKLLDPTFRAPEPKTGGRWVLVERTEHGAEVWRYEI